MFKNFYPEHLIISYFKNHHKIDISKDFIDCADVQLTKDFLLKTGIKITKNIGLGFSLYPEFFYHCGEVSTISSNISINNYANASTINWKSKSGRIYDPGDAAIDCYDIVFWFERLDPLEYYKQLQPNNTLPFKLNNLTYELVVSALNMDMAIEIWLKNEQVTYANLLVEKIDQMIDDYNVKSLKEDRDGGVVHNWKRRIENDKLIYDIDTGSAGVIFLKKFLMFLSKLNTFHKIEVS